MHGLSYVIQSCEIIRGNSNQIGGLLIKISYLHKTAAMPCIDCNPSKGRTCIYLYFYLPCKSLFLEPPGRREVILNVFHVHGPRFHEALFDVRETTALRFLIVFTTHLYVHDDLAQLTTQIVAAIS